MSDSPMTDLEFKHHSTKVISMEIIAALGLIADSRGSKLADEIYISVFMTLMATYVYNMSLRANEALGEGVGADVFIECRKHMQDCIAQAFERAAADLSGGTLSPSYVCDIKLVSTGSRTPMCDS